MIVEMRRQQLKFGAIPAVEERYASALQARIKLSPLGGFWHTEIGTLNQVIQIWPYESLAEREQVANQAARLVAWPPDIQQFLLEDDTLILEPLPFSPPITPRRLGNIYEIRTYSYRPGFMPELIKHWGDKIEERQKLSPFVGAWQTTIGPLNKLVHIWAYNDAAERQRIRARAVELGIWPPRANTVGILMKQENILAIPAAFSPLH